MTNETLALKNPQQIQCLLLSSPTYGDIRTFIIEEKPWFAGKDVGFVLGYKGTNTVIKNYIRSDDQRILCRSDLPYTLPIGMKLSGRGLIVINESALTDLAIRSKKRNASKFRHWLIENLPIIKGTVISSHDVADTDMTDGISASEPGLIPFESLVFGNVRTTIINNEFWFVGRDVATALEFKNTSDALANNVDPEDKIMGSAMATPSIVDSMGRVQHPVWINESGVYTLIFKSRSERAKSFRRWVTDEVLPTLRKTGSYTMPGLRDETIILPKTEYEELVSIRDKWNALGEASIQTLTVCAEKLKLPETQIKVKDTKPQKNPPMQPALKKILPKPYTMSVDRFAKLLKPAYPLITRNKLFQWLRESGYLSPDNAPIQEYVKKGYLQPVERMTPQGLYIKPLITAEGQSYFIRELEELHSDIKE